jgi:hypothetical protein
MKNYEEISKECEYIDTNIDPPPPIITIQNHTIATSGNFITLTGLPKSRKTTFAVFGIASALTGKSFFDIKVNLNEDEKIVLFDTEQSIYDFSRQMKMLKKAINKPSLPDNFKAYLFRKYDPVDVLNSMYYVIKNNLPKIIIIDNLTELVINPNDVSESKSVIQFLKRITAEYNIVVICLLHLNKNNLMSTGNLGSLADRGAQSVLKVTLDKDLGVSTLEPILLRSSAHFEPISITYNNDLKKYEQTKTEKKDTRKKFVLSSLTSVDHINRLNVIFLNVKEWTYGEFVEEIKKIYGVGTNISKQQIIPYLLGNNYLINNKGSYSKNDKI